MGLAKSTDLLHWQIHDPLWAPGIGPHCDCPQLIEHGSRWYLFYLQRNTRYRVADAPAGPFQRPPARDLLAMYAAAGSRPVYDGRRWISYPFVVALDAEKDLGDCKNGGPLAVPRELHFHPDAIIHERPLTEVVATLDRLPVLSVEPRPLVGDWDTSTARRLACTSDAGGTLLFPNLPGDLYLEAEVVLPCRPMEAHLILRAAENLDGGYKLALHPDQHLVDLRPTSGGDINRVLVSRSVELPVGKPIKLQLFLADSVLEAFIDHRASITARVYERRQGALALEFRDAAGEFRNLRIRPLGGSRVT